MRPEGVGWGVLVHTGLGDGIYPVYLRTDPESGRTAGVYLDFGMTAGQERFFGTDEIPS